MVYIPWNQMGICRYWMLHRCHSGGNCKWRHPDPKERQWLWDYHTAKQLEEKQHGIPPPENPRKKLPEPVRSGVVGDAGGLNGPPPPLFAPPAPLPSHSYGGSRAAPSIVHGTEEGNYAAVSGLGNPQWHHHSIFKLDPMAPAWQSPSTSPYVADDVSMLDAPPSPKNDRGEVSLVGTQANAAPLGKPNRLARFQGGETPVPALQQVPGVHYTGLQSQASQHNQAQPVDSAFSPDVPSPAAVTLWKRSEPDVSDDIHRMDITEPGPRAGSYWERMRQQKASGVVSKVEPSHPPEENPPKLTQQNSRDEFTAAFHHQNPPSAPISSSPPSLGNTPTKTMGATKRLSNGEGKHVGPHPSTIRVSAPYLSQAAITKKLQQASTSQPQLDPQERSTAEAREDTIRLQGVGWIDNVRRSLQLPIRTYTTASVYFHKFRLAYAGSGANGGIDYNNAWPDACAAALLTACKVEDTLKKSRDILAAAYNLKASAHDQLGADDSVFEGPSRVVIGLERLVLEAGGFDFRSRNPHKLLLKVAKSLKAVDGEGDGGGIEIGEEERKRVGTVGWSVLTDLYRTFAPLKQTSATMALASLELAAHLTASTNPNSGSDNNTPTLILSAIQQLDYKKWSTTREEIMETLLDLLDLYTQHTSQTILGPKYSLDDFLRIRLAFNKECNESNISRYTTAPPPSEDRNTSATNGSTLRVSNGHPTPVSPMEPGPLPAQSQLQTQGANGNQAAQEGAGGTLRFMLNPELAADEKAQVQRFFVEEWEEYEEEIEIPQPQPQPRQPSLSRGRDAVRDRDRERVERSRDRPRDAPPPPRSDRTANHGADRDAGRGREDRDRERDRERDRIRDREREAERERARARDAERDRRYASDRRYDERKDRRYDDRDRRYEDDRRRGPGRR